MLLCGSPQVEDFLMIPLNSLGYCGSRKEQINFVRLRLKCSFLKDYLFQINIIDSGLRTCGKKETTAHYLLHCPNYIFIRNETIQTLGTIDVQSLIFGNSPHVRRPESIMFI
jgi:hypothetical protein